MAIKIDKDRLSLLRAELNRIVDIIIKGYNPEKIILFGSMVKEEIHEWSDIDLLIVKDTNKDYYDRIFELDNLIKCKVGLDLIVMNLDEYKKSLKENSIVTQGIMNKGRVLHEVER